MLAPTAPTYLTTNQLVTSPPTNQKNVHQLITPSWNHYCKTPHYPLKVRTHSFEGISLLCPPLPGKAVKLFFSTSPKTLSLRFNAVLGYRGQIRLQKQKENLWQVILDYSSVGLFPKLYFNDDSLYFF